MKQSPATAVMCMTHDDVHAGLMKQSPATTVMCAMGQQMVVGFLFVTSDKGTSDCAMSLLGAVVDSGRCLLQRVGLVQQ